MCRFLVYFGNEKILLADVITKPKHSIVQQSFCDSYLPFIGDSARRTLKHHRVNGDGFGVAWYDNIKDTPCVFTSIKPSWNDMNLQRLADHVKSNCIFSHVRAASPKSLIVETNCHPFQAGKILFMHNGCIAHFQKIKRKLVSELSDYCFSLISGTTDTEHAMALFISYLPNQDPMADHSGHVIKEAVLKTIRRILELTLEVNETPVASSLNFAITNGKVVIALRFKNSDFEEPPSLYVTKSINYTCTLNQPEEMPCSPKSQEALFKKPSFKRTVSKTSVVIASEPLTYDEDQWSLVPKNHLIVITTSHKIKMEPIEISRDYMITENMAAGVVKNDTIIPNENNLSNVCDSLSFSRIKCGSVEIINSLCAPKQPRSPLHLKELNEEELRPEQIKLRELAMTSTIPISRKSSSTEKQNLEASPGITKKILTIETTTNDSKYVVINASLSKQTLYYIISFLVLLICYFLLNLK